MVKLDEIKDEVKDVYSDVEGNLTTILAVGLPFIVAIFVIWKKYKKMQTYAKIMRNKAKNAFKRKRKY